jgi:hypothetical protein
MREVALFAACALAVSLAGCARGDAGAPVDADIGGSGDGSVIADARPIDAALMTCAGTDTCQTAMMLGSVSGDSNNQKLTASGHKGAWFRVRVTEDVDGIGGLSLRVAAKLTSPANVKFDTFVYVNTGSDVVECATTTGTVTTNGNLKQVRAEWGEGTIANGADDDRNVSIEIRPMNASGCSPSEMWQLEVEGNWN